MAVPPQGPYPPGEPGVRPRYGRYWGYYNRPRTGCGCLYTFLIFLLVWILVSWLITPLPFWYW